MCSAKKAAPLQEVFLGEDDGHSVCGEQGGGALILAAHYA